jgi:hypothetical protein
MPMTKTTTLLLAAGAFCVAWPALAGARMPIDPWAPVWACSAAEYAKRCNVVLTRHGHCQCIGGGSLGWRLNE